MRELLEKSCSVFMKDRIFCICRKKWTSARMCEDGEELDLQTQLKKCLAEEVPL